MEREALYAVTAELGIIKSVIRLLADLTSDARVRVLNYVADREGYVLEEK